jgi:hypothetical protein
VNRKMERMSEKKKEKRKKRKEKKEKNLQICCSPSNVGAICPHMHRY